MGRRTEGKENEKHLPAMQMCCFPTVACLLVPYHRALHRAVSYCAMLHFDFHDVVQYCRHSCLSLPYFVDSFALDLLQLFLVRQRLRKVTERRGETAAVGADEHRQIAAENNPLLNSSQARIVHKIRHNAFPNSGPLRNLVVV